MSLLACACAAKESQFNEKRGNLLDGKASRQKSSSPYKEGKSEMFQASMSGLYHSDSLQYELFGVIGKGHMGRSTISLAKHVPSDSLVAIKKVNLEVWEREMSYLQDELVLSRLLSHPNILPFHCCFSAQQELWTVMPLMAFGSCRDLMQAYFTAGLPETVVIYVLREVLQAVEYLHCRGLIHRGIKASHVLISEIGQVCLAGMNNVLDTFQNGKWLRIVHHYPEHASDCVFSYSPELLEQNLGGYSNKSDIYSVGILACELANGQSPFSDVPATQMLLEKLSGTRPRLADSTTVGEFIIDENEVTDDESRTAQECADDIFFKRTFSPHLHDLANSCLERDPAARPPASQLLGHPVFKFIKGQLSSELPSMLHPVTPLTDIAKAPKDLSSEDDDIARKMSEVSMLEDWAF